MPPARHTSPIYEGKTRRLNYLRALHSFHEAGLEEVRAQTFVGDVQTPLSRGERTAIASLFEMLWGQPQPDVTPEDRQEYLRLCTPGSPDFILDIPDYYAFLHIPCFGAKCLVSETSEPPCPASVAPLRGKSK